MPFIRKPGITGKIYLPAASSRGGTKHPCRDCFACQLCSSDRCRICRDLTRDPRCGKPQALDPQSTQSCRDRKDTAEG